MEPSSTRRKILTGTGLALFSGAAGAATGVVATRERAEQERPAASLAIPEFAMHASEIRAAQSKQTRETVATLRKKYQDPIFGKMRVWEMFQKLGMCIDASDNSLMLTSQFHHVLQILEAMELHAVRDRDLHLIALLHDLGKVMLLAGEAPEHVVGFIHPLEKGTQGAGLDQLVFQFGHDEYIYSRLKNEVPEHIAWTIRYHSASVESIRPYCSAKELGYLDQYLAIFQPFDLGFKSYSHMPAVDLAKYRALIEDTFPNPILF